MLGGTHTLAQLISVIYFINVEVSMCCWFLYSDVQKTPVATGLLSFLNALHPAGKSASSGWLCVCGMCLYGVWRM